MTKEQEITIALIRTAITGEVCPMPSNIDWSKVIDFASAQGVLGLCFEAIEFLKNHKSSDSFTPFPDTNNLLNWFGRVEHLKTFYEQHRRIIGKLAQFYSNNGIKMMLLKGYGLSQYWPTPEHRPVGDIDIYLGHLWKFGDQMVHDKLGITVDDSHEHHTTFQFNNVMVENHYDFINTKGNASSRELEKVYKELAEESFQEEPSIPNIYLPSPSLNATFLIRHLGQHFAGAEATLRQVLDWGFFLRRESNNVNWAMVIPVIKKAGMYEFFCLINAICIEYFGLVFQDVTKFQLDSESIDKTLELRILEDILNPEFKDSKPSDGTLQIICFKTKRFFANSWKRRLVYREGICSQLLYGSIAHLRRFNTIKD